MDMRTLPVSISEAGRWHYAFVYELTHRYFPEIVEKARFITESQARQHLLERYLASVGLASAKSMASVFRWTLEKTESSLKTLTDKADKVVPVSLEAEKGVFYAYKNLL